MGCTSSKVRPEPSQQASPASAGAVSSASKKNMPLTRAKALSKINAVVDKEIQNLQRNSVQKALFLGTGESGKSTLFKQMRLTYGKGFTDFERMQYGKLVWNETLRTMRMLVDLCDEDLLEFDSELSTVPDLKKAADWWIGDQMPLDVAYSKNVLQSLDLTREAFLKQESSTEARAFLQSHMIPKNDANSAFKVNNNILQGNKEPVTSLHLLGQGVPFYKLELAMAPKVFPPEDEVPTIAEIGKAVYILWKRCPNQLKQLVASNCLSVETNAAFFLNKVKELQVPGYLASNEDIIHARIKTTGITTAQFKVNNQDLVVTDVGGQRIERRKWIYSFDDVTCVLFVASVSEYDMGLVEDASVNRLDEALATFSQTVNSQWFRAKSVQLFLNKTDILQEKCKISKFSNFFPKFRGDNNDPEQIMDFIEEQFKSRFRSSGRSLYVHRTCATDTKAMKFVISSVSDMILMENMKWAGMI